MSDSDWDEEVTSSEEEDDSEYEDEDEEEDDEYPQRRSSGRRRRQRAEKKKLKREADLNALGPWREVFEELDHKEGAAGVELTGAVNCQAPPELHAALSSITLHGELEVPLPVPASGPIVDRLKEVCALSPHGKGAETVRDPSVRSSLEVEPDHVTLPAGLDAMVQSQVQAMAKELGDIEPNALNIKGALHKFLYYPEGSFFKLHRDTEKVPGMFATFVLILPSRYTGGEFVTMSNGKTKTVQSEGVGDEATTPAHCILLYADVAHEIQVVTAGCRTALVYNVFWTSAEGSADAGASPALPMKAVNVSKATRLIASILEDNFFSSSATQEDTQEPLVFALEHLYTESSLKRHLGQGKGKGSGPVGTLKGRDRKLLTEIHNALDYLRCQQNPTTGGDLDFYLVQRTFTKEMGCMAWGSEDIPSDDSDWDVAETTQKEVWWSMDLGTQSSLPCLLDDADTMCVDTSRSWPEDYIEDETGVEFTGNEGATKEVQYHATCLVLTSPGQLSKMVLLQGESATCDYLRLIGKGLADNEATMIFSSFWGSALGRWPDSAQLVGVLAELLSEIPLTFEPRDKDKGYDTFLQAAKAFIKCQITISQQVVKIFKTFEYDAAELWSEVVAADLLSKSRHLAELSHLCTVAVAQPQHPSILAATRATAAAQLDLEQARERIVAFRVPASNPYATTTDAKKKQHHPAATVIHVIASDEVNGKLENLLAESLRSNPETSWEGVEKYIEGLGLMSNQNPKMMDGTQSTHATMESHRQRIAVMCGTTLQGLIGTGPAPQLRHPRVPVAVLKAFDDARVPDKVRAGFVDGKVTSLRLVFPSEAAAKRFHCHDSSVSTSYRTPAATNDRVNVPGNSGRGSAQWRPHVVTVTKKPERKSQDAVSLYKKRKAALTELEKEFNITSSPKAEVGEAAQGDTAAGPETEPKAKPTAGAQAKKERKRSTPQPDDTALATLLSMGIAKPTARWALENTEGNVERAVEWVFSHPGGAPAAGTDADVPSSRGKRSRDTVDETEVIVISDGDGED